MLTYPSVPKPSYSYVGSQAFNTLSNQYASGKESRFKLMRFSKRTFTMLYPYLVLSDRNTLHDFFRQVYGSAENFWFVDFASRKWIDEYVGRVVLNNLIGAVADDGGVRTDQTTAAGNSTANDMTLFPASVAVSDAYYFGYATLPWDVLRINIGTGSGAWTGTVAWEYFSTSGWATLSNVVDGTNTFKNTGVVDVLWDRPTDMALINVKGISAYWIRARCTAIGASYTQPKGTQAWAASRYYDLHGLTTSGQVIYVDGVTDGAENRALLHCNGTVGSVTITDQYAGHTWTCYGNAQLQTAEKVFGTASIMFDGAGDYVSSSNFTNMGEKFTLEGWWHTDVLATAQQGIIFCGNSNGMGLFLGYNVGGDKKMYLFVSGDQTSWDVASTAGTKTDWVAGTWYKWVVDYDGSTYRVWFGTAGALTLDISVTSSVKPCPITLVQLGAVGGASWFLDGGIDEVRLTFGNSLYGSLLTPRAETAELLVDYSILTGGGYAGADRVKFNFLPPSSSLITSDFTGFLRVKGRLNADNFQEEMSKDIPNTFNTKLEVTEVQW